MAKALWAFLVHMLFYGCNDLITHAGSSVSKDAVHYLFLAFAAQSFTTFPHSLQPIQLCEMDFYIEYYQAVAICDFPFLNANESNSVLLSGFLYNVHFMDWLLGKSLLMKTQR